MAAGEASMLRNVSAAALLFLLLLGGSAHANDIHVNPVTGSDANNGLSPATAVRTVQRGFNLLAPAGTVHLAAGDYRASLGQVFPARSLFSTRDVTVLGAGIDATFLDGEGTAQVLSLDGDKVHVEGLTIRRGNSPVGGCLYVGEPVTMSVINVAANPCP